MRKDVEPNGSEQSPKKDPSEVRGRLIEIYQQAFAGHPWYENVSTEEVEARISKHFQRDGVTLITEEVDDEIVGATWSYPDTFSGIASQKNGRQLLKSIEQMMEEKDIYDVVYICETIVATDFQGKGIASKLKQRQLAELKEQYPDGVIVYTRMRDDNVGILAINTKAGFARTGIRVPSSSNPDISHEYWFTVLDKEETEVQEKY